MGVTLEDVGRHCGVSRSTVSRVINNSPLVNDATKERVLKSIKELSYAPNFIARSLTKNRTETLAVTLPDITGGVFPEILAGMDEVVSQHGYHLLIVFLGGPRPKSATVEELITHRRVDAVLAIASTLSDAELSHLAEYNMPLVCVAQRSPIAGIPSVTFDDAGGALQATRLLLSKNRRKIVHIRGPLGNFDAEERSRGFRKALEEGGVRYDANREVLGDFKQEGGLRAMREILDKKVPFDGVFASNDEMAIGAIEALGERGLTVPYDAAVVGFDDIPSARFLGLSTVRVPMREMGRVAAKLAFQLIEGKPPAGSETLNTEIVQRTSTRIDKLNRPLTMHHTIRM